MRPVVRLLAATSHEPVIQSPRDSENRMRRHPAAASPDIGCSALRRAQTLGDEQGFELRWSAREAPPDDFR